MSILNDVKKIICWLQCFVARLCLLLRNKHFQNTAVHTLCHDPNKNGITKGDLHTLVVLFSFFELNLYEVIIKRKPLNGHIFTCTNYTDIPCFLTQSPFKPTRPPSVIKVESMPTNLQVFTEWPWQIRIWNCEKNWPFPSHESQKNEKLSFLCMQCFQYHCPKHFIF